MTVLVDETGWAGLRGTPKHGSRGRYSRGCRCDTCRAALREYAKSYRAQRQRPRKVRADSGVPKVPSAHGTNAEYVRGCRCPLCKEAHAHARRAVTGYEKMTPERRAGAGLRRRDRNRARRAAIRTTSAATQMYSAVLERDPCAYCGAPGGTIDHIVPLARGGAHDWTNLTAACRRCNSSKGTRSLLAFLASRK